MIFYASNYIKSTVMNTDKDLHRSFLHSTM